MGSSSSKFRKHLQNGDEYAALQLYYSSSDLRKGLDPNSSYGDTYSHDTPLHYAARHAMKSLLRYVINITNSLLWCSKDITKYSLFMDKQ